jgi:hypothetical protein
MMPHADNLASALLALVPVGGIMAVTTDVMDGLGEWKQLGIAGFAVGGMVVLWLYLKHKDELLAQANLDALKAKDDACKALAEAHGENKEQLQAEIEYLRRELEKRDK